MGRWSALRGGSRFVGELGNPGPDEVFSRRDRHREHVAGESPRLTSEKLEGTAVKDLLDERAILSATIGEQIDQLSTARARSLGGVPMTLCYTPVSAIKPTTYIVR